MGFEIRRKRANQHGVYYRGCGNFIFVYKPGSAWYLTYLRWVDASQITEEMVREDYGDFTKGRLFYSRVNKHGVEFILDGARFRYKGDEYEIGLPYLTDVSHVYTPEMLMEIMRRYGSYSNASQMWVPLDEIAPVEPLQPDSVEF